jgi:hypothetical protein
MGSKLMPGTHQKRGNIKEVKSVSIQLKFRTKVLLSFHDELLYTSGPTQSEDHRITDIMCEALLEFERSTPAWDNVLQKIY